MKYSIRITEILSRCITVDADTKEEAIDKVNEMYRKCKIILDAEDFVKVIFKEEKIC